MGAWASSRSKHCTLHVLTQPQRRGGALARDRHGGPGREERGSARPQRRCAGRGGNSHTGGCPEPRKPGRPARRRRLLDAGHGQQRCPCAGAGRRAGRDGRPPRHVRARADPASIHQRLLQRLPRRLRLLRLPHPTYWTFCSYARFARTHARKLGTSTAICEGIAHSCTHWGIQPCASVCVDMSHCTPTSPSRLPSRSSRTPSTAA